MKSFDFDFVFLVMCVCVILRETKRLSTLSIIHHKFMEFSRNTSKKRRQCKMVVNNTPLLPPLSVSLWTILRIHKGWVKLRYLDKLDYKCVWLNVYFWKSCLYFICISIG